MIKKDLGTLVAELIGGILGEITKWSILAFIAYILYWNTLGA